MSGAAAAAAGAMHCEKQVQCAYWSALHYGDLEAKQQLLDAGVPDEELEGAVCLMRVALSDLPDMPLYVLREVPHAAALLDVDPGPLHSALAALVGRFEHDAILKGVRRAYTAYVVARDAVIHVYFSRAHRVVLNDAHGRVVLRIVPEELMRVRQADVPAEGGLPCFGFDGVGTPARVWEQNLGGLYTFLNVEMRRVVKKPRAKRAHPAAADAADVADDDFGQANDPVLEALLAAAQAAQPVVVWEYRKRMACATRLWLNGPHVRIYGRMEFDPTCEADYANMDKRVAPHSLPALNTWSGFAYPVDWCREQLEHLVRVEQRAWRDEADRRLHAILTHFAVVLCGHNSNPRLYRPELFRYMLGFLAQIIQHPGQRHESMLLTVGAPGVGKSRTWSLMCRILGPLLSVSVGGFAALNDQFNGPFCGGRILLNIDEAVSDGREQVSTRPLRLITEDTVMVRRMYREAREVPNHMAVVGSTNYRNQIELQAGSRKLVLAPAGGAILLRPLDARRAYFRRLLIATGELAAGDGTPRWLGIARFCAFLADIDLARCNTTNPPLREVIDEQIIIHQSAVGQVLFTWLQEGAITGSSTGDAEYHLSDDPLHPTDVPQRDLLRCFRYQRDEQGFKATGWSTQAFFTACNEMLASTRWSLRPRHANNAGRRRWMVRLPPLSAWRRAVSQYLTSSERDLFATAADQPPPTAPSQPVLTVVRPPPPPSPPRSPPHLVQAILAPGISHVLFTPLPGQRAVDVSSPSVDMSQDASAFVRQHPAAADEHSTVGAPEAAVDDEDDEDDDDGGDEDAKGFVRCPANVHELIAAVTLPGTLSHSAAVGTLVAAAEAGLQARDGDMVACTCDLMLRAVETYAECAMAADPLVDAADTYGHAAVVLQHGHLRPQTLEASIVLLGLLRAGYTRYVIMLIKAFMRNVHRRWIERSRSASSGLGDGRDGGAAHLRAIRGAEEPAVQAEIDEVLGASVVDAHRVAHEHLCLLLRTQPESLRLGVAPLGGQ